MRNFSLIFPDDFDDYAWEVEAKGWLNDVILETNGQKFRIMFYDLARLSQDIESALAINAAFVEKNVVVVPHVTRLAIEQAVQFMAISDGFARLKSET